MYQTSPIAGIGIMNSRLMAIGVVIWIFSIALFAVRGYHPNFIIPLVVGTVIFLYGLIKG